MSIKKCKNQFSVKSQGNPCSQKDCKPFQALSKTCQVHYQNRSENNAGIFKNENLMAKNSSRMLKWFLWLQNFDFEIVYKTGYLNCVFYMLTREELQEKPSLKMFGYGASNSSNKKSNL